MPGKLTVVLDPCLGTAFWTYVPESNSAWCDFACSSVALTETQPLDLHFDHRFFSATLTDEQNEKIVAALNEFISSLGAIKIKVEIVKHTSVLQTILVEYEAPKFPVEGVDILCTRIADVCEKITDELATFC